MINVYLKRCIAFVTTYILTLTSIFAQSDFHLTHYSDAEGLPQNSVKFIISDNAGYIWLSTEDGLVRFDGYHFRTYSKNELNTSSNRMQAFYRLNKTLYCYTANCEPINEYSYSDNSASVNSNYSYRLKLVDNGDRLYGYSRIKTANLECAVANIKVYPNPTSGIVNVSLPADFDKVDINVYSVAGHKVRTDVKSNGKNYTINLSHLATGIYFIEVLHDGYAQKFKVLKK